MTTILGVRREKVTAVLSKAFKCSRRGKVSNWWIISEGIWMLFSINSCLKTTISTSWNVARCGSRITCTKLKHLQPCPCNRQCYQRKQDDVLAHWRCTRYPTEHHRLIIEQISNVSQKKTNEIKLFIKSKYSIACHDINYVFFSELYTISDFLNFLAVFYLARSEWADLSSQIDSWTRDQSRCGDGSRERCQQEVPSPKFAVSSGSTQFNGLKVVCSAFAAKIKCKIHYIPKRQYQEGLHSSKCLAQPSCSWKRVRLAWKRRDPVFKIKNLPNFLV